MLLAVGTPVALSVDKLRCERIGRFDFFLVPIRFFFTALDALVKRTQSIS